MFKAAKTCMMIAIAICGHELSQAQCADLCDVQGETQCDPPCGVQSKAMVTIDRATIYDVTIVVTSSRGVWLHAEHAADQPGTGSVAVKSHAAESMVDARTACKWDLKSLSRKYEVDFKHFFTSGVDA